MTGNETTTTTLKYLAMGVMLIDHIGASLVTAWMRMNYASESYEMIQTLYMSMRLIGRLAFPLFLFVMIEGFFYTRSRGKYLGRLLVFCAISQIPFNLALQPYLLKNGLMFWLKNYRLNVFFTLAIGFASLWAIETVRPRLRGEGEERMKRTEMILRTALCILIALAGCVLAEKLRTDYGWAGVAAMIMGYIVKLGGFGSLELFAILAPLIILSGNEAIAVIDQLWIRKYRGGKGSGGNRWVFYLFYPVHLLILGLIRWKMER